MMGDDGTLSAWAIPIALAAVLGGAFWLGVVSPHLRAILRRRREAARQRQPCETDPALIRAWLASSPHRTPEPGARNPGAQRQHQE